MEFKKKFKYGLKESDAKGDLKGFPLEIIEKMIDNQVLQGNPPNVSVFIKHRDGGKSYGGFNWDAYIDGIKFLSNVILNRHYNYFYKKYPRK